MATTTLQPSDISIINGTLSGFSGSGSSYSATATPTANTSGNMTIQVAATLFTDVAGNTNTASSVLSIAFNTVSTGSGTIGSPNTNTGGTPTIDSGGTTTPVTKVAPKLRVRKTVTLKKIAIYAGLTVAKTSKVSATVSKASMKYCTPQSTRVKGIKVGHCKITVKVTPKEGKSRKRTVTLLVTK